MNNTTLTGRDFPGLYQSSNKASIDAQASYFRGLFSYLVLIVVAASTTYMWPSHEYSAFAAIILFIITLGILIYLKVIRPDDQWYNGRAVAESVKTRTWRWCMRAQPYGDIENKEIVSKEFISDLRVILKQNMSLSNILPPDAGTRAPISEVMLAIRELDVLDRLKIYKSQRIDNQANWYASKSILNKKQSKRLFIASVLLHLIAISLLAFRIKEPTANLPIEVIATCAAAVLTWLQAKKHNELQSSYALTAHEIVLIKGESASVTTEAELADFVFNSETAFSREHTQWAARKVE